VSHILRVRVHVSVKLIYEKENIDPLKRAILPRGYGERTVYRRVIKYPYCYFLSENKRANPNHF
jgi:hypothetical protein